MMLRASLSRVPRLHDARSPGTLSNQGHCQRVCKLMMILHERNDPYGEHDFGSFEFCGETIFWKFEYYDLDFQMQSLDPSDPTITARCCNDSAGP